MSPFAWLSDYSSTLYVPKKVVVSQGISVKQVYKNFIVVYKAACYKWV